MNTHVIFKAFSNSLLARTLKSGMLATIMLSQTFPNLLAFKINMCTNSYLSGLPNLPAYPPIYMYLDYILLYPIYEPTYLGYLIGQHTRLLAFCFTNPPVYLPTRCHGYQTDWHIKRPMWLTLPNSLLSTYLGNTYLAYGYMHVKSANGKK